VNSQSHKDRKHSKFSASAFRRIRNCSGSVALSEGVPNKDNRFSIEGTKAHEVLEKIVRARLKDEPALFERDVPDEMIDHAKHASRHIFKTLNEQEGSELMVEERVYLDFIHQEAFGTLDYGILDHFGTLNILDYKYGVSLVSPKENEQFIFYALAVAHRYQWNFKRVRMWTLQPRVKGFDGFVFWEISMKQLMDYIPLFEAIIERAEMYPHEFTEGDHCHWCPAKGKCPLKQESKAANMFGSSIYGEQKEESELLFYPSY